jgi:hypothetical protein
MTTSPEQLLDLAQQPIVFVALVGCLFVAIAGSQSGYVQTLLPTLLLQTALFSRPRAE